MRSASDHPKRPPYERGGDLSQHCQAVLAAADQADEALAPHRNELRGDLCVNAPVLFGQRVLAAIAARFAAAHPGLRLHVELTNTHVAPVETGCDLVIRTGDLPDLSLRARLLARASFVAVATPDVIAAHGDPRDLKGLAGKPCIVFGGAKERRSRFPSAPPDPVAVTTAFTSNDLEVTRQAALSGIGFAILPRFSIADAIEDGRLRVASRSSLLQPSKLHAIFPGHPIPQAGAHAFANEVASQLRESLIGHRRRSRQILVAAVIENHRPDFAALRHRHPRPSSTAWHATSTPPAVTCAGLSTLHRSFASGHQDGTYTPKAVQ